MAHLSAFDTMQKTMGDARKARAAAEAAALQAWTKAEGDEAKREAMEALTRTIAEQSAAMVEIFADAHETWLTARAEAEELREIERAEERERRKAEKAAAEAEKPKAEKKSKKRAKGEVVEQTAE